LAGKNYYLDGSLSIWSDIEVAGTVHYAIDGLGAVTYRGAKPTDSGNSSNSISRRRSLFTKVPQNQEI
jgi:hypothetical protein